MYEVKPWAKFMESWLLGLRITVWIIIKRLNTERNAKNLTDLQWEKTFELLLEKLHNQQEIFHQALHIQECSCQG